MTPQQLIAATGCAPSLAEKWAAPVTDAMADYDITTSARVAAFLAQIAHESGQFVYVRELWGPTVAQLRYERAWDAPWPPTSENAKNRKAYELGNLERGDGFRYRGRGLIQITGRSNYEAVGRALGVPFVDDPGRLEEPLYAAKSAGWYWHTHGLNALADSSEFERITRAINGGLTGQPERVALFERATAALA